MDSAEEEEVTMEAVGRSSFTRQKSLEEVTAASIYNTWAIGGLRDEELEDLQRRLDEQKISEFEDQETEIFELKDSMPMITEAVQVIVKDDFTQCFRQQKPKCWNWNAYLFPIWCFGVMVRYVLFLPLRFLAGAIGVAIFALGFVIVLCLPKGELRTNYERSLLQFLMMVFVISLSGVIKYHGVRPKRGPNQIFVANHTSMIDVVILQQHMTYAVVGQQHSGIVGFIQNYILGCLGCLWFERGEVRDRVRVAEKIKEHILDESNNPLLIFPEGTCVNNKYCVMFKKGAFELGAKVYPIAIKYNLAFCDPFWNSMKESFWYHIFKIMKAWALVCDVYYLKPQEIRPGEQPQDFALRVKEMIAKKAKLRSVPWDGYLKRLKPSTRFMRYRQKLFAAKMLRRIEEIKAERTPQREEGEAAGEGEVDLAMPDGVATGKGAESEGLLLPPGVLSSSQRDSQEEALGSSLQLSDAAESNRDSESDEDEDEEDFSDDGY
eukprot:TRINITY_DN4998_c0_g1_i1.p1 TRINITY_DN4998_c0_g1~~TRINITY_DN4998_c0_g1_i1.p1  ORF type:complete len:492 (-),score=166.29 TRINITY_DN4998_c0_g1_i1:272-1747(-)